MNSDWDVKLQPRSAIEIFSWSFRYYQENFREFFVLVTPGFAVWLTIFLFVFRYDAANSPTEPLQEAGIHEIYVALSLFVFLFLSATVTAVGTAAISAQLLAKELNAGRAFMRALDIGFPLLGTLTLSTVIITIGLRLFLIPGIIAYVLFCMAPPVVMIEGEGGLGALKRSRAVVKDYFNKTFLILVPVAVLEIVLALCVLFLSNLFGDLFFLHHLLLSTVFAILLFLVAPLKIVATTMLYYDLRIRKEGYDLQSLSEELEESP